MRRALRYKACLPQNKWVSCRRLSGISLLLIINLSEIMGTADLCASYKKKAPCSAHLGIFSYSGNQVSLLSNTSVVRCLDAYVLEDAFVCS